MPHPDDPTVSGDSEIVGREPEQRRIDDFLADVRNGARVLVLRGEPGIGKTVLWSWAIDRARQRGYRVVRSRPAEEEMVIPLAGLVDLLQEESSFPAAIAPDTDQMSRGRAVLDALRGMATAGPVVIAVDDLQWLDAVSGRALRFALRRLDAEPIGVLASTHATSESDDPVLPAATLLPGRATTILVGPLPFEAMRSLLAGTVTTISRPLLHRIHEMSGGNPFYAIELANYVARHGGGDPRAGGALPASLEAIVQERLAGLPAELNDLLEVVAVVGRVRLSTLQGLLPNKDVAAQLTLGRAKRLLVVDNDVDVRFSHALLAAAVYGRMALQARRSWHAEIARLATDPDQRAWHIAMSTEAPDEEAASLIEAAADRAADRGAPVIAAQLAEHSLRLTPPGMTDAAHRRAFTQIDYLAGAGEVGRALSLAGELIDTMPAGPARAEAMLREWELDDDFHPTGSEEHLTRTLEEAAGDDRLRIRILTTLGRGREFAGDLEGGIEACREALSIAESLGDPSIEMNAAAILAYLETKAGVPRWDLMDRAMALEHDLRMPVISQSPSELMVGLLLWQGELAEARRLLGVTARTAAEAGLEWKSLQHDYGLALLECMAGNLDVAAEAVDRAMTAAKDAEDPWSERALLYPHGLVAAWLGHVESARAAAGELIRADHGLRFANVNGHKVLGLLALAAGDWREAAAQLAEASTLSEEAGVRHPGVDRELPDAVEALALSGDLDGAAALLERLERKAATVEGPWPDAAALRARGALLVATGDGDEAAGLLGEAMARFDQLGFRPDAARSRLLEGRALARAGHRSRAAQALADAHQRFAAIGAVVWQRKAADELDRVAPGRVSGTLTKTEAGIAALIGEGMRNREIGESLFMSVATVEAHLTRIYRKLGIRSRTELSRLVASGDLPLPDHEASAGSGRG